MLDYKVVSLHNKSNQFSIDIFQRTRTEFKIRTQVGFNSYSDDYVWGLYDLTRSVFCFLINGYELLTNNLGYEFAYSVHSGDFSGLEESVEEPPQLTRCSQFITAYEEPIEEQAEEPAEEPPIEDLLIRTQNVILDPEVELPWKLAD